MKDFAESIELILTKNDTLQQTIDTAVQTVCDELGIDASQYIHHVSIASDGIDLTKEGQRRQLQRDIEDYLAKDKKIDVIESPRKLLKDYKFIDEQLDAIQREHDNGQSGKTTEDTEVS